MIVVGRGTVSRIQRSRRRADRSGALNIVLGFGFIFISGFALLPAMIVVLITEAFYIRSVLTYAVGGAHRRAGLLSRAGPVRSRDLHFDGIVRRHLEIMTGAGIVAGLVYWMIAGRNAGAWREPPRPLPAAAAAAVPFAAAAEGESDEPPRAFSFSTSLG